MGKAVFIFSLLCFSCAYSQDYDQRIYLGNVISDSSTLTADWHDRNAQSILNSEHNIEIRLFSYSFNTMEIYTLYFDTSWSGSHQKRSWDGKEVVKEMNSSVIDSVFKILVDNRIFSLPDSRTIVTDKLWYDPATNQLLGEGFGSGCGVSSSVEFKILGEVRRYSFSNEEIYHERFPEHPEFGAYCKIVKAFRFLAAEEK